jgi:hypothetical protein
MLGHFLAEKWETTAMLNARAIGECETAQAILDLDLEQLLEEPDDDSGE